MFRLKICCHVQSKGRARPTRTAQCFYNNEFRSNGSTNESKHTYTHRELLTFLIYKHILISIIYDARYILQQIMEMYACGRAGKKTNEENGIFRAFVQWKSGYL